MDSLIHSINDFFDFFWKASTYSEKYFSIILCGFLSSVLFLVIFKIFSNQDAIRRQKKIVTGNILQIKIYRDDILTIILSLIGILKHNFIYLKHTLFPLLIVFVPLVVFSVQINNRTGFTSFDADDVFIVRADLDTDLKVNSREDALDEVSLTASPGLRVETPKIRVPSMGEALWRLRVLPEAEKGSESIRIELPMRQYFFAKKVATNATAGMISPVTAKLNLSSGLLHNAEGFLPKDSPLKRIEISYPRARYPLFGWETDSIWLYFICMFGFALLLKPVFRVAL